MAKPDKQAPKPEDEVIDPNAEVDVALSPENENPGGDVVVPVEEPDAGGNEDWKVQFEAAQKKAEEAEARRVEAERLAQSRQAEIERFQKENSQAKTEVANSNLAAVDNAIANADHERGEAKAKLKAAMESGDYEAVADAQDQLAAVAIKAQRLKEGKAHIERQIEVAKQAVDPVEQYTKTLTAQSAAWIRSHPEVVKEADKRSALERAHYSALGEGITPDTPEYFAHMDKKMGYAQPEVAAETLIPATATTQPARQPSAPVAPVSRGGSIDAPQARQTTIRLTAAQREIAAACGMSDTEYAKQLIAIQRENAMTH